MRIETQAFAHLVNVELLFAMNSNINLKLDVVIYINIYRVRDAVWQPQKE